MYKKFMIFALTLVLFWAILPGASADAQWDSDEALENVHVQLGTFTTFEKVTDAYSTWIEAGIVVVLDARQGEMANWPLTAQIEVYSQENGVSIDSLVEFASTPAGFDMTVVPEGDVWVVESSLDPELFLPAYTAVVKFEEMEDGGLWKYSYSQTLSTSYYTMDDGLDAIWENPSDSCELTFDGEIHALLDQGYSLEELIVFGGPTRVVIYSELYSAEQLIRIYAVTTQGCLRLVE